MKKPIVTGSRYSLPFSRGILARSLEVIGVGPDKAYKIATNVQNELLNNNIKSISRDDLRETIYKELKTELNEKKADKFNEFRRLKKKPLIFLIGGATGSGKSSISVDLAHRLDITTVISTDTIREIMRDTVSKKLIPSLHESSYLAWRKLDVTMETDPVILGFKQQAAKVNIGIDGIIERSLKEKTSVIINGVHILPSLVAKKRFPNVDIHIVFLYLKDPDQHKQRFYYREESGEIRKASRYIDNFEHIRKIQDYLLSETKEYGYACIENLHSIDTAQKIIEDMMERSNGW